MRRQPRLSEGMVVAERRLYTAGRNLFISLYGSSDRLHLVSAVARVQRQKVNFSELPCSSARVALVVVARLEIEAVAPVDRRHVPHRPPVHMDGEHRAADAYEYVQTLAKRISYSRAYTAFYVSVILAALVEARKGARSAARF